MGPRAHDVPYGTGVSDIPAILDELKRQGFAGNISIEYEWTTGKPPSRKWPSASASSAATARPKSDPALPVESVETVKRAAAWGRSPRPMLQPLRSAHFSLSRRAPTIYPGRA